MKKNILSITFGSLAIVVMIAISILLPNLTPASSEVPVEIIQRMDGKDLLYCLILEERDLDSNVISGSLIMSNAFNAMDITSSISDFLVTKDGEREYSFVANVENLEDNEFKLIISSDEAEYVEIIEIIEI